VYHGDVTYATWNAIMTHLATLRCCQWINPQLIPAVLTILWLQEWQNSLNDTAKVHYVHPGARDIISLLSTHDKRSLHVGSHHLFVSLHYHPSDEQYMMLICQVSQNVVSDVFILHKFGFFFFFLGQLLVFYYTLLSCSCCCACLICNCFTFCEQK